MYIKVIWIRSGPRGARGTTEGLLVRRRRRKRLSRGSTVAAEAPQRSNERWSMDFVSDCVAGRRPIRALTLVDDYRREWLVIEVDTLTTPEATRPQSYRKE